MPNIKHPSNKPTHALNELFLARNGVEELTPTTSAQCLRNTVNEIDVIIKNLHTFQNMATMNPDVSEMLDLKSCEEFDSKVYHKLEKATLFLSNQADLLGNDYGNMDTLYGPPDDIVMKLHEAPKPNTKKTDTNLFDEDWD